jgi:hypothetical protein
MHPVVRAGLTVALAAVGFLAFCLIIAALVMIMWMSPVG